MNGCRTPVSAALAALALAAGMAAPGAAVAQSLRVEAAAGVSAMPRGARDLCARDPIACAPVGPPSADAVEIAATAALPAQRGWARRTPSPGAPPRALWRALRHFNAELNWRIRPQTDQDTFGVAEYWARPTFDEDGFAAGDCEDVALEKRARLLEAGWPPSAIRLAVVDAPRLGLHVVLLLDTADGQVVLDSRGDALTPVGAANYRWVAVQRSSSLADWSLALVRAHDPS